MSKSHSSVRSTEIRLLIIFASPLAVLVVLTLILMKRGSAETMRLQAEKNAATIAKQVLTDRKHYVNNVVAKLKGTEFGAREGYHADSPYVPLPATFVMGVAEDVSTSQDEYRYSLVSRWNINPDNALDDEFLEGGFADLLEQEAKAKSAGELSVGKPFTAWDPISEVITAEDGHTYLRYLAPDTAVGMACVSCHNVLEAERGDVIALRREAKVDTGHVFALNDLMGAIAVSIDMEDVEAVSAASLQTTTLGMVLGALILVGMTFYFVRRTLITPMTKMQGTLAQLSSGDLRCRLDESHPALSAVATDFNKFVDSLEEGLGGVNQGTRGLESTASTVEETSRTLSENATSQAGSLEEFSAALLEIEGQVRGTSERAGQADERSRSAQATTQTGVERVKGLSSAMEEITESSKNVESVIHVIDQIAFQTNLLALNAAVEAARAGEAGKGFAVVAEEVRGLAMRSAQAASETSGMIAKSIERVERGSELAEEVGETFGEIAEGIAEVTALLGEISGACVQQSTGVTEMVSGVDVLQTVTIGTASQAEQLTSACAATRTEVERLSTLLLGFQLS